MKKIKRKLKGAFKKVSSWAKRNVLSLLILCIQGISLYRIEGLHEKLDKLPETVGMMLNALYIGIFMLMNDLAGIIIKILEIVKGQPS